MRDNAIEAMGVEEPESDGLAFRVLCGATRVAALVLLSPALLAVAAVSGLGMACRPVAPRAPRSVAPIPIPAPRGLRRRGLVAR